MKSTGPHPNEKNFYSDEEPDYVSPVEVFLVAYRWLAPVLLLVGILTFFYLVQPLAHLYDRLGWERGPLSPINEAALALIMIGFIWLMRKLPRG